MTHFHNDRNHHFVVVGLGSTSDESIRRASALGVSSLSRKDRVVVVDGMGNDHAAAVGAHLSLYKFNQLKTRSSPPAPIQLFPFSNTNSSLTTTNDPHSNSFADKSWHSGVVYAQAQNLARKLMDMPANLMTPSIFSSHACEELKKYENVTVHVRDIKWVKEQRMEAFAAVSQGSHEPLKLLEIYYTGRPSSGANPLETVPNPTIDLCLVGKGVTFDSGGISIKPSANMALMKGDMGGAAVTLATLVLTQLRPTHFLRRSA